MKFKIKEMLSMKLELISFKICPFVQRAVITLLYKNITHEITYIDLASPPDWFTEISPFGKTPVIKVNNEHVIFESAIIDEFLDESFPGSLLPSDALQRAIDRSWIDFGSNLLLTFSGLIHSKEEKVYTAKRDAVIKQFDWLEEKLGKGPYFNDDSFSLVDIAYAPLFMRTDLLNMQNLLYPSKNYPKISAWADKLLEIDVLSNSVVSNFDELLKSHIKKVAPYAATQLNL